VGILVTVVLGRTLWNARHLTRGDGVTGTSASQAALPAKEENAATVLAALQQQVDALERQVQALQQQQQQPANQPGGASLRGTTVPELVTASTATTTNRTVTLADLYQRFDHHLPQPRTTDDAPVRCANRTRASPTMSSDLYKNQTSASFPISICVIVRTYFGQAAQLPTLLDSLVMERHHQATRLPDLTTQVFVVDTMPEKHYPAHANDPYAQSFGEWLSKLQQSAEARAGRPDAVRILEPNFKPDKETFGYDATNFVLDYLRARQSQYQCSHYMFTNGDNYYLPVLWTELQALLPKYNLIAWDFLTHHPRPHNLISVKWERGHIDLGTFIVRSNYLLENNQTLNFGYGFAADFEFLKKLLPLVPADKRYVLHQARMAHN
jgi:acyl transferase domain-containing protein